MRLLGALTENARELAELASPVFPVDANDPPLLLLHGDQDPQMPINSGTRTAGVYEKFGLDVQFDVVHGAVNGGAAFYSPAHLQMRLHFSNERRSLTFTLP